MSGLMMNFALTITSVMDYARLNYPNTEIVSVTHDNPKHRYTLTQAFARVRQLSNALRCIGVEQGDRIATLAWNDHRHFELYYAISCSGMICHTINPRLSTEQLEYVINHAEDRVLFVDPFFLPLIEAVANKIPSVKTFVILSDQEHMPETSIPNLVCYEQFILRQSDTFQFPSLEETSASALCYTSGTTGLPKGVLYDHRSTVLHAYASSLPGAMNINTESVVMPLVPMFHVNAWGIPYSAMIAGCKLVFAGPHMLNGALLAQLINEEHVCSASGVPTIWMALLNYLEQSGETIESLQRIVVGGAACPLSIMETMEDRYGVYVHTGWGMTEMSPMGTINPRLDRNALGAEQYALQRVKAGRAVYGVEMKLVDDAGQELPRDGISAGRLLVRGPWVCRAYFRQEHSDAHDTDGWFDTGDVATIDRNGFMQVTDRSKDVIKSGGEWISSIALENLATDHPAIEEAAVIAVPHRKWSERPLLLAIAKRDSQVTTGELLAWYEGKVPRWWIPERCLLVDHLPHTATGKLDKKALRAQFQSLIPDAQENAETTA